MNRQGSNFYKFGILYPEIWNLEFEILPLFHFKDFEFNTAVLQATFLGSIAGSWFCFAKCLLMDNSIF